MRGEEDRRGNHRGERIGEGIIEERGEDKRGSHRGERRVEREQ